MDIGLDNENNNTEIVSYLAKQTIITKNNRLVKILSTDLTPYLNEQFGFIDPQFPHVFSSITGTENEDNQTVEWLPAQNIQEQTNYSEEIPSVNSNLFHKTSISHALTLVDWFAHDLCSQIFLKQISPYHLYRFDVMIDGAFTNIPIDSYIPVYSQTRQEIFTKCHKGSIFPCLYQKLLAKIYGDYYSITSEFIDIIELQTFYCREELSTTQGITHIQLQQIIDQKIEEKSIVSFRTRNSIRLQSFGLESNHIYIILRLIQKEDGPIIEFLELQGENWIGKMSKVRSNWLIQEPNFIQDNKIMLSEQYKQNYMTLSDMKGIARQLVILNNTSQYHKNYHSCHPHQKCLTLYRFTLQKRNHLMFRTNYKHKKCYNSLIVVEKIQNKQIGSDSFCQYRLIKSFFHENKDNNYVELSLERGEYFIIVYNSHLQEDNRAYNITVFSSEHFVELVPFINEIDVLNVLENTFKNYFQQHVEPSKQPIIFKHLYPLTGLAFIYAQPTYSSLQLSINTELLEQSKIFSLNLPKPTNQTPIIKTIKKQEKQLLIFRCHWSKKQNITFDYETKKQIQKITFPPINSIIVKQKTNY